MQRRLVASVLCLILWDATTTYTDGTPIQGPVRYLVHFDPREKKQPLQVLADTDQTQLTLPTCDLGTYWITAYQVPDQSDESISSNRVTLTPGKGK